jgi:hypothetical protein
MLDRDLAMLSGVLNSERAIQVNIAIMSFCEASGNAVLKQGTCSQRTNVPENSTSPK